MDQNSSPLVSIITPSYNQGKFIEHTLESVHKQKYQNIEHIVIDGGSTDGTIEILEKYEYKYNLQWVSESDSGQSHAINKGFERAAGQIIGWLNSDDIYADRQTIQMAVKEFQRQDVDVLFGDDVLIDEHNRILKVRIMPKFSPERIKRYESISQPATFFRDKVIRNYSIKDNLHYSMDVDFFLRICNEYSFKHFNRILAGNRIHRNRKTIADKKTAKEESKKVRKSHGYNNDFMNKIKINLIDKPSIGIRRIKGIKKLFLIDNSETFLYFQDSKITQILFQFYSLERILEKNE